MKKDKCLSLLLFASTLLGVLVGCTQKQEVTVITVFSSYKYDNLKKLVETTYSDIVLESEISFYPSEQTRRLNKGIGPDLVVTNGYDEDYYNNYLLDISSSVASTLYDESLMKQIAHSGHAYSLPFPGKYIGFVYNETLFIENDIPLPTSSSELIDAFIELTNKGIGLGASGDSVSFQNTYSSDLGVAYLSMGIPDFFGLVEGNTWINKFKNKEETMKGNLEFIYEDIIKPLVDNKLVDVDVLSHKKNSIDYADRMLNGTLIATFGDSALYTDIHNQKATRDDNNYSFKMMPLLSDEDNPKWTLAFPSNYLGINKSISKHKQEKALKILELVSSVEGQEALMNDVNGVFSYIKNADEINSVIPEGLEECLTTNRYLYSPKITGEIIDHLGTVILKTITGELEISDALALVDDYYYNEDVDSGLDVKPVGIVDQSMLYENYNTRRGETLIGNLTADSVKYASGADIAVVNGGGIRAGLYQGEVYNSDLRDVCPYGNLVIVVSMTGKTLYEMMEHSLSFYEESLPGGAFLQCSGIKYSFNFNNEIGERLISLTLEDGSKIDNNKNYNVAINNYMAGSSTYVDRNGDGFTMLNIYDDSIAKGNLSLVKETNLTYYDCLAKYFDEYYHVSSEISGRITDEGKAN